MKLSECKTTRERAEFLEKTLSISLSNIQKCIVDPDELVHCENRIGSVSLPLGVAGPLCIFGENVRGKCYVPLATTEGALVASVNRGAKATAEKGIVTTVQKVGVTRGPVLKAGTIGGAIKIEKWIQSHGKELAQKAGGTSSHIKLIDNMVRRAGMYVFVRFSFDCDKAMGMNMATIAAQHLIEYIAKNTNSSIIAVAGNFDIDKKPAWLNSLYGRGYIVQAEAIISNGVVIKILKTSPQKIFEVWKTKCLIGSALSGSLGFNAHHANIVAAFYGATGQDLAHVVEGSLGMTIIDVLDDGSLYISVHLPSIMVGTIGGGTQLATQSEARTILKTDSPLVLAEVLAAAVLSGELSLLSSLSEGTLASTHKKLGR
ncbi:MAG: 3-hydroxy-3-methylglutaryl-CoA reductase [bacterium]